MRGWETDDSSCNWFCPIQFPAMGGGEMSPAVLWLTIGHAEAEVAYDIDIVTLVKQINLCLLELFIEDTIC